MCSTGQVISIERVGLSAWNMSLEYVVGKAHFSAEVFDH